MAWPGMGFSTANEKERGTEMTNLLSNARGLVLGLVAVVGCGNTQQLPSGNPDLGLGCAAGTVACSSGCANTKSDVKNCGTCDNVCSNDNGTPSCVVGTCHIACTAGYGNCNSDPVDGCEVNFGNDPNHCGGCGKACSEKHLTPDCAAGACTGTCEQGYDDCNGNKRTDGCEVSLNNDPNHCGACNVQCPADKICSRGNCQCPPGEAECGGKCVAIASDAQNCGVCGKTCSTNHIAPACTNGECGGTCKTGYDDCNQHMTDGCEVSLNSDVQNCGVCGTTCPDQNGAPFCIGGGCRLVCNPGFGECDGIALDGCETNLATDIFNCDVCGSTCSSKNGKAACVFGVCQIICVTGYADCNNDATDGCEVNLKTSQFNCGGCGTVCSANNATAQCIAGICHVACNIGFVDCNHDTTDGCEVNTVGDVRNCGSCGNRCPGTNGTASCNNGVCQITCAAGFGNCNSDISDGCEVNTNADTTNCGGCGVVCPLGQPCFAGKCQLSCTDGIQNGTETDVDCGGSCSACVDGKRCKLTTDCQANHNCLSGFCRPPPTCTDGLWNGQESATDCGGSACPACPVGYACNTGRDCASGVCQWVCLAPTCTDGVRNGSESDLDCGGVCPTQCGAGRACSQGSDCTSGVCTGNICQAPPCFNGSLDVGETGVDCGGVCLAKCSLGKGCVAPTDCVTNTCTNNVCGCPPGLADCNHNLADGCEVNTKTDLQNCGGCGFTCPTAPTATMACNNSQCVIAGCSVSYADCDQVVLNGCEVHPATDPNNCGNCGHTCSFPNAVANCNSGQCVRGACNIGYADCDGNTLNGCEVKTTGDVFNCSACGKACSNINGTPFCTASTCYIACNNGFANCDGNAGNGCEVNLLGDVRNCGSCSTSCSGNNIAVVICQSGACTGACNPGFADCNGDKQTDGCEVNIVGDPANCGGCNQACSHLNNAPTCAGGTCHVVCNPGFADCNNNVSDGCETAILNNPAACGACGAPCPAPNTCVANVCVTPSDMTEPRDMMPDITEVTDLAEVPDGGVGD